MNRIVDKLRLFSKYWRLNSFVQSSLWCERISQQVLVANWKLGRDKTKLCSHHISRLNKTVSNYFSRSYHCHQQDITVLPSLFANKSQWQIGNWVKSGEDKTKLCSCRISNSIEIFSLQTMLTCEQSRVIFLNQNENEQYVLTSKFCFS